MKTTSARTQTNPSACNKVYEIYNISISEGYILRRSCAIVRKLLYTTYNKMCVVTVFYVLVYAV
jgi:hypothetical protein